MTLLLPERVDRLSRRFPLRIARTLPLESLATASTPPEAAGFGRTFRALRNRNYILLRRFAEHVIVIRDHASLGFCCNFFGQRIRHHRLFGLGQLVFDGQGLWRLWRGNFPWSDAYASTVCLPSVSAVRGCHAKLIEPDGSWPSGMLCESLPSITMETTNPFFAMPVINGRSMPESAFTTGLNRTGAGVRGRTAIPTELEAKLSFPRESRAMAAIVCSPIERPLSSTPKLAVPEAWLRTAVRARLLVDLRKHVHGRRRAECLDLPGFR